MENEKKVESNMPIPAVLYPSMTEEDKKHLRKWQNKLLPFMVGVPSVLIVVFMWITTKQVNDFNAKVNNNKTAELIGSVIPSYSDSAYRNNMEYIKWLSLIHMEEVSINKRYDQAGFFIMSRVILKYIGFLTGMILAIIGAAFIIGKLTEATTTIGGNVAEKASVSIASSSPGIIFGFFGTLLMIACMAINTEIGVKDQPLYLHPNNIQFIGTKSAAKPVQKINPAMLDSIDAANFK